MPIGLLQVEKAEKKEHNARHIVMVGCAFSLKDYRHYYLYYSRFLWLYN